MSDKVGVYITFWAAPGKAQALEAAVLTMAEVAAREEGTLAYGFHRVSGDKGEGVSVYEVYENGEAQRIHGESAAINELKARLPEFLGAPPERHQFTPIPGAKGLPF